MNFNMGYSAGGALDYADWAFDESNASVEHIQQLSAVETQSSAAVGGVFSVFTDSAAFKTHSSVCVQPHTFLGMGIGPRWYTKHETLNIDVKHRCTDGDTRITATVSMDSRTGTITIEDKQVDIRYTVRQGVVISGDTRRRISHHPMIRLADADIMLDDHGGFILCAHRDIADPGSLGETIMAITGDSVKPSVIFAKNLDTNTKISA